MAQKKFTQAPERSVFLVLNSTKNLSKKLLKESERFRRRNAIVEIACDLESRKKIYECCPSCLKAHLIKKAEEWNLDKDLSNILFLMVEHETGHYGHYLDEGKLIKF